MVHAPRCCLLHRDVLVDSVNEDLIAGLLVSSCLVVSCTDFLFGHDHCGTSTSGVRGRLSISSWLGRIVRRVDRARLVLPCVLLCSGQERERSFIAVLRLHTGVHCEDCLKLLLRETKVSEFLWALYRGGSLCASLHQDVVGVLGGVSLCSGGSSLTL